MIEIRDKATLSHFFEADKPLHLYELGDLDPFFWPQTRWFGWPVEGDVAAVALLYMGSSAPSLLLLERSNDDAARALLRSIREQLPRTLFAHLSPGLEQCFEPRTLTPYGRHLKMILKAPEKVLQVTADRVRRLSVADAEALARFYESSYPGNWFMPRMLETGQYFAAFEEGELASVAGVHVYSPAYRVAALGNITTSAAMRGRGLATITTARVCQSLLENVDTIGLNVHAKNHSAIRCYQRLGFEAVAEYDEYKIELGPESTATGDSNMAGCLGGSSR